MEAGVSRTLNQFALALGLVLIASPALADPCTAIPDRGPMPPGLQRGATFSGAVVYVGDGDSLCVGNSRDPLTWIEVRLADFYAAELHAPGGAEAKATLERVTRGQRLVCTANHRSHDRVVAVCRVSSDSVGSLLRRAGEREGGNAYRPAGR